jgi:hypothetical protein
MGIEPQVKAGGMKPHNEPVRVRTALKAGGRYLNHNETVVREACCDLDTPQAKTDKPSRGAFRSAGGARGADRGFSCTTVDLRVELRRAGVRDELGLPVGMYG